MNYLRLATTFGPYIALAVVTALAILFFANWQGAREDVGEWKERHRQAAEQSTALDGRLKAANAKINATAKSGSVSYGQCQDLAATDAARAFDRGVIFGRNTCGSPPSPAASRSPPAPSQPRP